MEKLLEFIVADQLVPVVALTLLLAVIGGRLAAGNELVIRWARRAAAAGLISLSLALIDQMKPVTASDYILVLIRALMGTGLVWTSSTALFAIFAWVHAVVLCPNMDLHRQAQGRAAVASRERARQLEEKETERLRKEEQQRRERRNAKAMRRAQIQAAIADKDRIARIQDARDEVTRFYEEHFEIVGTSLPRPLFRVQLKNKLNLSIAAQDTWPVAENMIASIVCIVNRIRTEGQERETQERRAQRQIDSIQHQIHEIERQKVLFAQSPTADEEIVAYEMRAFDHQIAALRDQISAIVQAKESKP